MCGLPDGGIIYSNAARFNANILDIKACGIMEESIKVL
jgi:hypothetical protein